MCNSVLREVVLSSSSSRSNEFSAFRDCRWTQFGLLQKRWWFLGFRVRRTSLLGRCGASRRVVLRGELRRDNCGVWCWGFFSSSGVDYSNGAVSRLEPTTQNELHEKRKNTQMKNRVRQFNMSRGEYICGIGIAKYDGRKKKKRRTFNRWRSCSFETPMTFLQNGNPGIGQRY